MSSLLRNYWWQPNRDLCRDDVRLAHEVGQLPPLKILSVRDLVCVQYKLSIYHDKFKDELRSAANDQWDNISLEWLKQIDKQSLLLTSEDCRQILSASANLGQTLYPKFMRQCCEKMLEISDEPKYHIETLYALANLGWAPEEECIHHLCSDILDKLDLLDNDQNAKALRALGVLSAFMPSFPGSGMDLFAELLTRIDPNALNSKRKNACYLSCLRLAPSAAALFPLSPNENCQSKSEIDFKDRICRTEGITTDENAAYIDLLGKWVDVAIDMGGSKKIFIEFDGPYHFTRNWAGKIQEMYGDNLLLNGPTQLMTSLIRQCQPGHPLVRVPYFIAETILDEEWAPFVESLADLQPGAYFLRRGRGRGELKFGKILSYSLPANKINSHHATPQNA